MKKIFITGGSGFIGRNLREQLENSYSISAPTHAELELLDQEATYQFLKKNKFEVIIHAATYDATQISQNDKTKVLSNNLRMFFNLARHSQLYGKMIYFGSGAEYDRQHWAPKIREDYFDRYVPKGDYGFSKYIMAKYTEHSDNIYDLRLFGIFGKYEDWEIRFISNACCKAVWDLPITIKQNVFFDYLHIQDLVKITEWFIRNKPKKNSYNVCTGQTFDLLTLAKKVLKISEKNLDIKIKGEGLGKEYSGDNSLLLNEIGGYAFLNIDTCIKELYQWYLTRKDSIDREKLLIDK